MTQSQRIHPAVLDAASALRQGKVNRREFLRFATLLGGSLQAGTRDGVFQVTAHLPYAAAAGARQ